MIMVTILYNLFNIIILIIYLYALSVSEIKVLFGAPTGCTSPKTVRPGISPCTLIVCSYNNWLKKRAHSGRDATLQSSKI